MLLGNGDETFQKAKAYAAGSIPICVATNDLNNDTKLDLVEANLNDDSVSVLLGNGDGTFQKSIDYATGSRPEAVILIDLNNDTKLDIATVNSQDSIVSVYYLVTVMEPFSNNCAIQFYLLQGI